MTLLECIAAVVVASVAAAGFVSFYLSAVRGHMEREGTTIALFLGQGLMEEIKSRRFDENYVPPFSERLGTDASEDASDKASFDDVDDFDGWTETAGFRGYTLSARVDYVEEENLEEVSPTATGYKRVSVKISAGREALVVLRSVVSGW